MHGIQITLAQNIGVNQRHHLGQAGADGRKNTGLGIKQRLLGHIRDAGVALYLQAAVVGFFHTRENFQQRRFAGPVATDQANTLLGLKGEISVVEQGNMPKSELGVKQGDEGHEAGIIYRQFQATP